MDGQSVKTTERGGIRGFDAHKRVKGRKRHILVDTFGLLIACRVEPADISDRRAAALLLGGLGALFPNIRTVIADAGHQSRKLARAPVAPRRLEAADRQTPAARVQDHRPHMDCGAQLRLAWAQSTIEQGLQYACRAGDAHRNRRNTPYAQPPRSGMRLFKHALARRRGKLKGTSG